MIAFVLLPLSCRVHVRYVVKLKASFVAVGRHGRRSWMHAHTTAHTIHPACTCTSARLHAPRLLRAPRAIEEQEQEEEFDDESIARHDSCRPLRLGVSGPREFYHVFVFLGSRMTM